MHRNLTHNKYYATCAQFADATLDFLREQVPRNWAHFCDSVMCALPKRWIVERTLANVRLVEPLPPTG
jgi:hypothetical protein